MFKLLYMMTFYKRKSSNFVFVYSHFSLWGFLVNFHPFGKASFKLVFISAAPPPPPVPITRCWASILAKSTIPVSLPRPARQDGGLITSKTKKTSLTLPLNIGTAMRCFNNWWFWEQQSPSPEWRPASSAEWRSRASWWWWRSPP